MNKKITQNQKVNRRDFLKIISLIILSISFGSFTSFSQSSLTSTKKDHSGYGNSRYGY
ncbi:hypothetical protein HC766_00825 [Candidatus Gracilibacteria bacterium]|nr:hypothetical protein [Candidatus Gracilibacteria bacterium]